MSTTIQRGYSLPQDNFTIVPNAWLRDGRLTHKARGILIELMSHRPGWSTSVERLAEIGPDGEAAIKSGLKELEKCGYLQRAQVRGERGRMGQTVYTIVDPAMNPSAEEAPSVENRPAENLQVGPSVENRPTENPQVGPSVDFPLADKPLAENRGLKKMKTKKKREEEKGGVRKSGTSPARDAAAASTPLEQNLESTLEPREPSAPSAHQTAQQPDPAPVPRLSLVRPASGELATETPHTSRHCPRHPGGTSEPCGPCKDARIAHDTAEQAAVEAAKAARLQSERDTLVAARLAIADCTHCDNLGKRHDAPFVDCDHTPDQMERRRNGAARVRAALAAKQRAAN
ncbi:helix-turn-helix domain-containing protein [Prescottella equi]|uniref:helix-turn-helix domain-containing protein n=1 Tax=Rhodococcus hoagii TaxID=43767 RepID=UPI000D0F2B42|nr:helix-turn-helix domain-containing protein [Prescottella equi]AVP71340.1 hypothetical protein C7H75_24980 [Prescottella equi]